jgi:hypothetical protein
MFNITVDEVAERINSLTFEEKMVLLNGVTIHAALILQKLFPEDALIAWFVQTKQQLSGRA